MHIIVPYAQLVTQLKLDAFIDAMNEMQARLKNEGISLGYHNHADEFSENTDGTFAFDELIARTSLDLEIDTYWVYAAKLDAVAIMEEVKKRMPFIHIKDGYKNGKGMPLGRGTAPVIAVYQKAVSLGVPMVVESETLTPDGLTETGICMKYLRLLEKEEHSQNKGDK
jgi:sugar phosphate isomerase/epimerase